MGHQARRKVIIIMSRASSTADERAVLKHGTRLPSSIITARQAGQAAEDLPPRHRYLLHATGTRREADRSSSAQRSGRRTSSPLTNPDLLTGQVDSRWALFILAAKSSSGRGLVTSSCR